MELFSHHDDITFVQVQSPAPIFDLEKHFKEEIMRVKKETDYATLTKTRKGIKLRKNR